MDNKTPVPSHPVAVVLLAFDTWGYDTRDFEVTDFGPEAVHGLGEGSGMVAVRRRSSGDERFYLNGDDPSWFTELLDDVEKGHFGHSGEKGKSAAKPKNAGLTRRVGHTSTSGDDRPSWIGPLHALLLRLRRSLRGAPDAGDEGA